MSPRGAAGVRRAAQQRSESRSEDFQSAFWFRLPNAGDTAIVRFLEDADDLAYAENHECPPWKPSKFGREFGTMVPCMNQEPGDDEDCPGCSSPDERIKKKQFKGYVNIIWRDAPLYKRDEDGRMVRDADSNQPIQIGNADQVAIWSVGITIFNDFVEDVDDEYGLTTRDFKIKRKGTGKKTTYKIDPAGDEERMSSEDKKLASERFDLDYYVKPNLDRLERQLGIENVAGDFSPVTEAREKNPFKRKVQA